MSGQLFFPNTLRAEKWNKTMASVGFGNFGKWSGLSFPQLKDQNKLQQHTLNELRNIKLLFPRHKFQIIYETKSIKEP